MSKSTLIKALYKTEGIIEVNISKDFYVSDHRHFYLYKDNKPVLPLESVLELESNSSNLVSLPLKDFEFEFGKEYSIVTKDNIFVPLNLSKLAQTDAFEEKYRYDGKLGAIYSKEKTEFYLFTPFSSKVILNIRKPNEEWQNYRMIRNDENGVFYLCLEGDYDKAEYTYSITVFGKKSEVVDPYALSLGSNSRVGFVIDPEKIRKIPSKEENLPLLDDKTKAIIYECNVRDMTSLTSLKGKGTYELLSRPGLKTRDNLPIGLDYLASLGVTHIQIQPILDFQTVNDDMPFSSYNWGYDPSFFFAPEGSYAKDPNDPYSRLVELKGLISSLHMKGLRAIADVVYNHVYSTYYNSLSLLVPDYYFRRNNDGSLSNGSGCGNDIESRCYMARRLIIDSLMNLVDLYDFDGFRFDLMGIIDVETMNLAYKTLTEKKSGLLFYGEGWDLWTNLRGDEKSSILNSDKLPEIAFFNDRFREVSKGKTNESELSVPGYILGDTNYIDGFKHVMLGSSIPLAFAPLFRNHSQSLNYVECHDNHTLYDKIKASCFEDQEDQIERRIKMMDIAILFAAGIPFFHAGQEIGQSKSMKGNTYNSGDEDNGFRYDILRRRKDLYEFFIDAVNFKKKFIAMAGSRYKNINEYMSFVNLEYNALMVDYDLKDCVIHLIFNPTSHTFMYTFNDYVRFLFAMNGDVTSLDGYMRLVMVNSLSVMILCEAKNDKGDK